MTAAPVLGKDESVGPAPPACARESPRGDPSRSRFPTVWAASSTLERLTSCRQRQ
jgi:hypothetical protein